MKSESQPIGEIVYYFGRIKLQQRDSPHIHLLVWIKDVPVYGQSDISEGISFIDRYVTCKKDPTMPNLLNCHTHRHARTCRKKGKAICRFNFPFPPMPSTVILQY